MRTSLQQICPWLTDQQAAEIAATAIRAAWQLKAALKGAARSHRNWMLHVKCPTSEIETDRDVNRVVAYV